MFVHRKNTILSKKNRIEKYIHKKKRNKKVIKKRELVVHIQIEYEYMYIDQYIF